jgi:outer membrane protein insertion porin family
LRDAVGLRRGDSLTDSAISLAASAVTAFYRERSFFGARASASAAEYTPDSAGADLLVTVSEGARATVGRVDIQGAVSLPPERAAEAFGVPPDEPLRPERLEEGIGALLAEYERAGFPLARASVSSIDRMAADSAAPEDGPAAAPMLVTVSVREGERVRITGFRVEGNSETDEGVILRESRMDLPEEYDPAGVARFAGRLRRLGLFSSVEEPALYPASGGYGLLVRVREGRTSTFDGVVGYAPAPGGGGSGSVTGSAAVGMRNLFGTGRKLEAAWSRYARSTQEIRVAYEEPWVLGIPVNLGGGFSQRQQDSSFVDRRISLSAEFLASASFSVAAVGEVKRIIPSSSPSGAGIPGSRALTGGAVVRYDTRDDRELPRSGVNYRSEYRTGTRRPSGSGPGGAAGSGATVRHLEFDVDLFVPLGRTQVLDLALHGRELSAASIEPGDLYRLGGFRTLRGFREDRFSGTRVVWGTVEHRIIAEGKSYFFGFVDPGYAEGPAGAGDIFTYGYGLGVRLETGLGLVGVSFALGKGDPVSETKIHFGLVNDF